MSLVHRILGSQYRKETNPNGKFEKYSPVDSIKHNAEGVKENALEVGVPFAAGWYAAQSLLARDFKTAGQSALLGLFATIPAAVNIVHGLLRVATIVTHAVGGPVLKALSKPVRCEYPVEFFDKLDLNQTYSVTWKDRGTNREQKLVNLTPGQSPGKMVGYYSIPIEVKDKMKWAQD